MKKILKGIAISILAIVAIILIAGFVLYRGGLNRMNKVYSVPLETITIPTDSASIVGGRHLVEVHCAGCHGLNLNGGVVFQNSMLGTITSPAIAGGRGKFGTFLSDAELVRSIRQGVSIDGRSLIVMPSAYYYYFNDSDLGKIIAYIKGLKPADQTMPLSQFSPIGIALTQAGAFGKVIQAEMIDHTAPRPAAVAPGVTVAYGKYLVQVGECKMCHGPQLTGGKDPNPQAPPAPNLTRTGDLGTWSEGDFLTTLRTGVNPSGYTLTTFMPWKEFGRMTDDELKAVWLYIQSLPSQAAK